MDEVHCEGILQELLHLGNQECDPLTQFDSLKTFEEGGVLTNEKGLVITFGGCEFQLTIVRSK